MLSPEKETILMIVLRIVTRLLKSNGFNKIIKDDIFTFTDKDNEFISLLARYLCYDDTEGSHSVSASFLGLKDTLMCFKGKATRNNKYKLIVFFLTYDEYDSIQ